MIPVIKVSGKTIPEVWEESVVRTWNEGLDIKTEYDNPKDPPSKDVTMIMEIKEPLAEPRIHRAFPGGLEDLEIYRQEVINGVHDHWVGISETSWTYTYHQRLTAYNFENIPIHKSKESDIFINQMDYIVEKLTKSNYTRRAQGVTWNTYIDPPTDDPPCLQRIWCRMPIDKDGVYHLEMNTHWRSRDAYKAAFMNMWAITNWQAEIAKTIEEKIGQKVVVGRYVDIADSYHIYGSYFEEFKGFLKMLETREFEDRVWDSKFGEPMFEEARERLAKEK